MKNSRTDLAYAAGMMDGEGSIYTAIRNRQLMFHVSVSQKHPAVLYWFRMHFGGSVYAKHGQWRLSGSKGVEFLAALLPYMIVKNVDAVEAIVIWKSRADLNKTAEYIAERKLRRERADEIAIVGKAAKLRRLMGIDGIGPGTIVGGDRQAPEDES